MRLSTRLLLLILLCLAPMVAAQVYTQLNLRHEREAEVASLALRQVELANTDLSSILEGARQLLIATAETHQIAAAGTDCHDRLLMLVDRLPAYSFLALLGPDGRVLCASAPALRGAARPAWLASMSGSELRSGVYATQAGIPHPFLPLGLRLGSGGPGRWLVLGLDLDWLGHHLAPAALTEERKFGRNQVSILDRNGTIIARDPNAGESIGKAASADFRALIGRRGSGMTWIRNGSGQWEMAAYVSANVPPLGLTTVAALSSPGMMGGIAWLTVADVTLATICTILAVVLAFAVARHSLLRPIGRLLVAAGQWRDGNLSARAELGSDRSELGRVAAAFNDMATTLGMREHERAEAEERLEARVAERTQALLETNNRLQVEIAERARTEAALRQGHKLQAIGQLAGGVAHDFNNMLATVLGCLELIERRVAGIETADHERLHALIGRATDAVQRGAQLTSRLLAFSRRQFLAPQPTDVNRLVSEALALIASMLGSPIRVVTELDPGLWFAHVDPAQIDAALIDLCVNARDAMPDGGQLTISTGNETIERAAAGEELRPGNYVRVSLVDTGSGMPPEVLGRALDPFFTTKGPSSSGLGLSRAYGLARQSGGTLRLESAAESGTRVTLLLPRAATAAGAEPVGDTVDRTSVPSLGLSVLLVDDDAAVRQVTSDTLRDLGCTVVEACGGDEALALLDGEAREADLLVLDYAMPGLNGLQVARAARLSGISAPILLATGYAEPGGDEEFEGLIGAVLRKPYTLAELRAAIARVQRRTQPVSAIDSLCQARDG
ncbi:MAG: response regulator [Acetobacteraceae bacterium]